MSKVARPESSGPLIARIRASDPRAFEQLFHQYYEALVRFADRYTRTEIHSEDTVCELFEWIWHNRTTWAPKTSLQAYLYGALRNRLLNKIRTEQREETRAAAYVSMHKDDQMEYPISDDQIQSILENALTSLPEQQRLAVILRWQNQMSWEEVGEILGVTPDAARMLNQRAIQRLKDSIGNLTE